jgi:integrase
MHFIYWCVFVLGYELTRELFDPETIQAYVDEAIDGKTDGTRRNYRAWIVRVAEVVNPDRNPIRMKSLNSRGMEPPYTSKELVALRRWSEGQSTQYRRNGAQTLVALGAGAGLSSIEIAHLKVSCIEQHLDGSVEIHVHVDGDYKRSVIVSSPFDAKLAELVSSLESDRMAFLPNRASTTNDVVSNFISKLASPPGTPTITVRRLRNTWFVNHLTNRVDVFTLMRAAGLESLESISRLSAFVPEITDADRVAQLRGI